MRRERTVAAESGRGRRREAFNFVFIDFGICEHRNPEWLMMTKAGFDCDNFQFFGIQIFKL